MRNNLLKEDIINDYQIEIVIGRMKECLSKCRVSYIVLENGKIEVVLDEYTTRYIDFCKQFIDNRIEHLKNISKYEFNIKREASLMQD